MFVVHDSLYSRFTIHGFQDSRFTTHVTHTQRGADRTKLEMNCNYW